MSHIESHRKWQARLYHAIQLKALRIHNYTNEPQDIRILCPVNSGGWYCQWIAGHYGGCSLARNGAQMRLR